MLNNHTKFKGGGDISRHTFHCIFTTNGLAEGPPVWNGVCPNGWSGPAANVITIPGTSCQATVTYCFRVSYPTDMPPTVEFQIESITSDPHNTGGCDGLTN